MEHAPRTLRLLVVDDEPTVARVLERVLRPHQVTIAGDARNALALLNETSFDAVFCDLGLPGTSGAQLREALPPDSPLRDRWAFVTGGVLSSEDSRYLDRVQVPVIHKPFRAADVRGVLAQLVPEAERT